MDPKFEKIRKVGAFDNQQNVINSEESEHKDLLLPTRPKLLVTLETVAEKSEDNFSFDADLKEATTDLIQKQLMSGSSSIKDNARSLYEIVCQKVLEDNKEALASKNVVKPRATLVLDLFGRDDYFMQISAASEQQAIFEEIDAKEELNNIFEEQVKSLSSASAKDNLTDSSISKIVRYFVWDKLVKEENITLIENSAPPELSEIENLVEDAAEYFIGWGEPEQKDDFITEIHAIIKDSVLVSVSVDDKTLVSNSRVPKGTKIFDFLNKLDLKQPVSENYDVLENLYVFEQDSAIHLFSRRELVKVVFYVDIKDLCVDYSTLSDEEILDLSVIQTVEIPIGASAEPPDDSIIAQKGLTVPFDLYFRWEGSYDDVENDTMVRAVPLNVFERTCKMLSSSENVKELIQTSSVVTTVKTGFSLIRKGAKITARNVQEMQLLKAFELGEILETKDYVFYKHKRELMLARYTGTEYEIKIPAVVNGMYVKYVHPSFLNGGFGVNNRQGFFRKLFHKTSLFKVSAIGSVTQQVTCIKFPTTLLYLPSKCFYGCTSLEDVVLPHSLRDVNSTTFKGCRIENLIFNGPCPTGLLDCKLDSKIYVRREFYKTFKDVYYKLLEEREEIINR